MKTIQIHTVALSVLTLFASACSVEPTPKPSSQRDPASERAADDPPPAAPVTRDEIVDPRQGVVLDPSDYVATEGAYRLFGVEEGEGAPSAIIAEVKSWSTRPYREGDAIGRGLRVARIEPTKVTLQGARGDIVLEPGANVKLRVVRHRLDVVARPLGRHRFALDSAAARATWEGNRALPSFDALELFNGPVLKLGAVPPGSLLAETDFREGDLIAAVDGAPAGPTTLDEIARGLTDGRPSMTVRVYRGGVPLERSFIVMPR